MSKQPKSGTRPRRSKRMKAPRGPKMVTALEYNALLAELHEERQRGLASHLLLGSIVSMAGGELRIPPNVPLELPERWNITNDRDEDTNDFVLRFVDIDAQRSDAAGGA